MISAEKRSRGIFFLLLVLIIPTAAVAAGSVLIPPASVTGSSTTASFTATNNATGAAIRAVSVGGNGLAAVTNASSAAALNAVNTSATSGSAVLANSTGNTIEGASKNNSGVVGSTKNTSTSNAAAGVVGVDQGTALTNAGLRGTSTNGTGVVGASVNGTGITASSTNGISLVANSPGYPNNNNPTMLVLQSGSCAHGCSLAFEVAQPVPGGTPFPIMTVDNGGVVRAWNFIGGGASAVRSSMRTAAGTSVTGYAAQETSPSVEDLGEAALVSGQTYVHLSQNFASTIDPRRSYLVFVTPEGDNRGLYVTNQSLAGFEVRESQGGRSSLRFYWRVVARPFGSR